MALTSTRTLGRIRNANGGPQGRNRSRAWTMRAAWELIKSSRAALLSLEERATRLVPALVAGVVALWTQLGSFEAGAAEGLAWIAWALLIVALLNLGALVMPKRLAQFWDNLVPPEVVLAEPRPLRSHEGT